MQASFRGGHELSETDSARKKQEKESSVLRKWGVALLCVSQARWALPRL